MEAFIPIAILLVVGLIVCAAIFAITSVLGPKNPSAVKLSVYECGVRPEGNARTPFKNRFYLIAVLFLLFDVEAAFFFPWAVSLGVTGTFGLLAMLIFALVLVVALIYDYKKGALEWD